MLLMYSIYAFVTNLMASNAIDISNFTVNTKADILSISLSSKMTEDNDTNRAYYINSCWIGMSMVTVWLVMFFLMKYF